MIPSDLANSFKAIFPADLTEQVFETYSEVKRNFYLGHLRPNEVEGGRFAEAVFRLLEYQTTRQYTALGQQLDTERLIRNLSQLSPSAFPDSIRLHIPRTLRVIFDIRNKRDAAHLGDGIDPNIQDATLVSAACDWVMAELVRLYHGKKPSEAQGLIEELVSRKAPVVQEFGNSLKTLRPDFTLTDRILVLLYHRGQQGATFEELSNWVKPSQRKNLRTAVWKLENEKDFVYGSNEGFKLTRRGEFEVEKRKLLRLAV